MKIFSSADAMSLAVGMRESDVHVFVAPLAETSEAGEEFFRQSLPENVQRKADRFRFAQDRRRYIKAEYVQRRILTVYLDCPIESVRLSSEQQGKPVVDASSHPAAADLQLAMNLARCQSHVAVVVGRAATIGIDIEDRVFGISPLSLAAGNFSTTEFHHLESMPAGQLMAEFLKLWCCKEAVVKALGPGLAMPLNQFSITRLDQPRPRLDFCEARHGDATQWSLVSRMVVPGCQLAVAVRLAEASFQWRRIALSSAVRIVVSRFDFPGTPDSPAISPPSQLEY